MVIRRASISDTSIIVNLLKLTLGESLLPKSEKFWEWKHYHNPFGQSEILIAQEGDQIIGVRAFMRWNWTNDKSKVKAVRAVDTATHPAFQGKGVFSRLTLALLNQCKEDGYDLVFNTPNKKSLPGYKKMGWVEAGRMPISVRLSISSPRLFSNDYIDEVLNKYVCDPSLFENSGNLNTIQDKFFYTSISKDYFNWRYAQCPIIKYGVSGEANLSLVFFRLKKFGKYIELRICDVWRNPGVNENIIDELITSLKEEIKPLFVTLAPTIYGHNIRGSITMNRGPLTTICTIKNDFTLDFSNFSNWKPSVGSMELF